MRSYPRTRMRRTRKFPWIRDLVQENSLSVNDLCWATFVIEGKNVIEECPNFPGVHRYSIDQLLIKIEEAVNLGIKAVAIFPVIDGSLKDDLGTEAVNPNQLMIRAAQAIKIKFKNQFGLIADVALDPYTSHGQDGVVDGQGYVLNDETIDILTKQACLYSKAGFDVLAPSDMQDGRVLRIRDALEKEGYTETLILSYAAKFASKLYGPFRHAVGSSKNLMLKDKLHYQQNIANGNESIEEVRMDIYEGADMVMVKPAMMYQDVIKSIKDEFNIPLWAYQVSGEYTMIKNYHSDDKETMAIMLESLISLKRSGADVIISYASLEVAKVINKG